MAAEQNEEPRAKVDRSQSASRLAGMQRLLARAARATKRAAIHWARAGRATALAAWRHERSRRLRAELLQLARHARERGTRAWPATRRAATRLGILLLGLTLLGGATIAVGRFGLHPVRPGEIGVRSSVWSGRGVAPRDFGPGLHLGLPGLQQWYALPAGTELMRWRGPSEEDAGNPLDLRTSDGSTISLALTVPYRIRPGSAHRIVAEGHRGTYRQQAVAKTEQVLANELGRLPSEELTRSDLRGELLGSTLVALNQALAEIHVEAEAILIDELRFSEAYERKLVETQRERQRGRVLEARRLEDQEEQTILRRRHEIDRELQARRIELDREVETLRAEGQARAVELKRAADELEGALRADADREYELLVAQGEAARLEAEELERRLHAEVLSGKGGAELLALRAARATRLTEVTLNSDDPRVPNPLDVEAMVELFAGEGARQP